jgi:tripartite-type tricarboxylate transporter receptor subunit TctC
MNKRLDTAPDPQRRHCLRAAALGLAALSAGHAAAQRPALTRILCSGPGGSIPDLVARSVAEPLSAPPGPRVLVDNRPGAAGRLSIAALKAAPADGSTLLLAQGAIATVWQHVAYPGGPPAVTALLGGQIAALVLPEGLLRPHHVSRRLRVLATSGPARSSTLPEVPTFAEAGHADLVIKEWFAFFAPGRTPTALLTSLSADLRQALAQPGVAGAFQPAGMTPVSSTQQALAARIADEQRLWQPVLRARGIRAD